MLEIIKSEVKEINGVKYLFETLSNGAVTKKRYYNIRKPEPTKHIEVVTQEDIMAEILLGQAEILANQNAQDEVLAEMLLNSLEV